MSDGQPLLVFDLDGTLVETAPDLIAALNRTIALEGLPALPEDSVRQIVGRGSRYMLEQCFIMHNHQISPARLEDLIAIYIDTYGDHIADNSYPFPGVIEAMERHRAQGWAFAVCTNKPTGLSEKLLRQLQIDHWFNAIGGAGSFAATKPDPAHLGGTIAAAGGVPARAIMIGDSETDILAARNMDVPVICVDFGYTPVPVSELGPDVVISSYEQLDQAVASLSASW